MKVLKFKFDCLNNRFWRVEEEYSYEIPDECAFISPYGGQSFLLDSEQPNHWINFTIYDKNIRVFYKQFNKNEGIVYYQKDLPREKVVEFELSEEDIVAKRGGKWVKKINKN